MHNLHFLMFEGIKCISFNVNLYIYIKIISFEIEVTFYFSVRTSKKTELYNFIAKFVSVMGYIAYYSNKKN